MVQKFIKEPLEVREDIPMFGQDRYWGKASKDELEKSIATIEEKGWAEFKKNYKGGLDLTFEENRADWRFVIPVSKDFSVLDAGAGLGRISIPMARVAGRVTSVDSSFLRMKFLKKRAEKEGLKNIDVCVGDIFDLPFEKGSFDLIVMNGLLEWVGSTDRFDDPKEAQRASLRICKDLLKEGGFLYIGIENRFALAYLRGIDHSGFRFTSYMPRWVANMYSNFRKGKPYDTYTYTKRGYEKLIKECGFNDIEFYLPYPGYNLPRIMIPYENLKALSYVISSLMPSSGVKKSIARFLSRLPLVVWLYRCLFFSFSIIVRK